MLLFNCDFTSLQILECEFYLLELMVGFLFFFFYYCCLSLLFTDGEYFEFCAMKYALCCLVCFFFFSPRQF